MISTLALIVAAALVGILHMSAPDHWATLVMLSRSNKWTHSKLFKNSILTSLGHVVLSIILGFVVVIVGIVTSKFVLSAITKIIGVIMIAAGLFYAVKAYMSEEHCDESGKPHTHSREVGSFAVLGAALSPDLSILPIFLIAIPVGIAFAFQTAIVFAVASISTLLIMVFVGHYLVEHSRFAKRLENLDSRYNDALTGLVIAAVGVYILFFG